MLQGKLSALHCKALPAYLSIPAPFRKNKSTRPSVRRRAAEPTPEQAAEMQKAMEAGMKDPQVSRAVLSLSSVDNLGVPLVHQNCAGSTVS